MLTALGDLLTTSGTRIERPNRLRILNIFFAALLLYSAVAWISCLVHWKLGYPQAYASPFIHNPHDPFTDFRTYWLRIHRYLHTSDFFSFFPQPELAYFSYPAPAAVVYDALYHLPHSTVAFLFLASLWAVLLAALLATGLHRRTLSVGRASLLAVLTLLLAFPFDFMMERGNIEWVVWVLVTGGLLLLLRRHLAAAAIALGVAASIKLFPVIFCGIFLLRLRLRGVALTALTLAAAALSTLASLWFVGPTLLSAWRGFNGTVTNYQHSYSVPARPADVGMDHSLFALVKVAAQQLHLHYESWLHPYYLIAGAAALVLFVLALRLPLLNQILFLTLLAILLPPNSFDYTLVHLYLPWGLLCLAVAGARLRDRPTPGLLPLLLCFVPLFAPFNLFVWNGVRFGGQVQTLVLLLLLALCFRFPVADDLWTRSSTPSANPA